MESGLLKPSKIGNAHISKRIRKEIGNPDGIPFVVGTYVVILYDPKQKPRKIIACLKNLIESLELRITNRP